MASTNDFDPSKAFNDFNNTAETATIASSVVSVLVIVIIAVVIVYVCKNRKQIGKEIVKEVREISETLPLNSVSIWNAEDEDGSTMDRFFQEMNNAKPVRFTAAQLSSYTANYAKLLGSGGFGKVYEGKFRNGVRIAVKVLNKAANVGQQFMAEVGSIGRVHHINLVKLYGFCYDQSITALVYEFMENGSLDKHLFSENRVLEWDKLHKIALGTAKGIAYLHEDCDKRIIHYDIKPGNVLLDAKFCPKVADFGLARLSNMEDTHVSLTGLRGTPGYVAPEFTYRNYPISHKCDVYSFGIMMFEVVGRRRNKGENINDCDQSLDWFPKRVWTEYERGELVGLVKGCGIGEEDRSKAERMCMVALWCVQDPPEARPRMSDVVKMLEGGLEIVQPIPRPFSHLFQNAMRNNTSAVVRGSESESESDQSSTSRRMGSSSYKEKTYRKYEIGVATL